MVVGQGSSRDRLPLRKRSRCNPFCDMALFLYRCSSQNAGMSCILIKGWERNLEEVEMSESIVIEVIAFLLVYAVAKKIDSFHLYIACDIYLLYMLTGHSVRWTVSILLVIGVIFKLMTIIRSFFERVVFPEVRPLVRSKVNAWLIDRLNKK